MYLYSYLVLIFFRFLMTHLDSHWRHQAAGLS